MTTNSTDEARWTVGEGEGEENFEKFPTFNSFLFRLK